MSDDITIPFGGCEIGGVDEDDILHAEIARLTAELDVALAVNKIEQTAWDKLVADRDALRAAVEDAVDTMESMDLHIDNPLYDRLRDILQQETTGDQK